MQETERAIAAFKKLYQHVDELPIETAEKIQLAQEAILYAIAYRLEHDALKAEMADERT